MIADGDDVATVRPKGMGIQADGTSGTVVYEDVVRRTGVGWRLVLMAHRLAESRR